MTRVEKRQLKAQKTNEFKAFQKTEKKYWGDFKKWLSMIEDPRHGSYIDYSMEEILYPVILKNTMNLESMRDMTECFNTEEIIQNMGRILGKESLEEIPHYVTIIMSV